MTRGRRLDAEGRLLARAISEGHDAGRDDADAIRERGEALVTWAIEQGVTGLLHQRVGTQLQPGPAGILADSVLGDTVFHLIVLAVLERLAPVLDGAAVSWAVIKGPVLLETAYPGASRPYTDLDLIVAPSQFAAALEALEGAGARLIDRNWDLAVGDGRAELHLLDPTGSVLIDLHWHVINRGSVRRAFRLRTEELLERRTLLVLEPRSAVSQSSVSVPVLEATDRLIHYALHGAHSGGHRLIWLADVAESVRRDGPDWDALVERCRRWRADLPVGALLARSSATLGLSLPDGILEAMAGTAARRLLLQWLAPWQPAGRLPGGGSIRNGVTQSLAGTLPATTVLTSVRAGEMVRRVWDRYPHWLDPADPAHMEYPSGDPEGRRHYLEKVGS